MTTREHSDYYRILGVERHATIDEIKRAYHALVHRYHPDLNPDDCESVTRFKEITRAYNTLSDSQERARYDARLSAADRVRAQVARQAPAPQARHYSFGLNVRLGGISLPLGGVSVSVQNDEIRQWLRQAVEELTENNT